MQDAVVLLVQHDPDFVHLRPLRLSLTRQHLSLQSHKVFDVMIIVHTPAPNAYGSFRRAPTTKGDLLALPLLSLGNK